MAQAKNWSRRLIAVLVHEQLAHQFCARSVAARALDAQVSRPPADFSIASSALTRSSRGRSRNKRRGLDRAALFLRQRGRSVAHLCGRDDTSVVIVPPSGLLGAGLVL
jgi:hypothetical protein